MTEQQEKARFRQAIDHTLSDIQGDAFLAQWVLARAEKGEKPVKYHIPKAVVFALIALLCMGTVAVAAGLYGGTINFEGEITYNEMPDGPMPTVAPRPADEVSIQAERDEEAYAEALFAAENYAYEEALRTQTLYMLYEIKADGTRRPQSSIEVRVETTSQEAFDAMMTDAPWLPHPNYIPEGYIFDRAEVFYKCAADGEWERVKSETIDNLFAVEWYKPTKPVATGYWLVYRESAEGDLDIEFYVELTPEYKPGNANFGFGEGMMAQAVTVPGMENAIAIIGEHFCSVNMRRALESPMDVLYVNEDGQWHRPLADVYVDITAPMMDVNDLILLFAAE